jgi:hypothetical protein
VFTFRPAARSGFVIDEFVTLVNVFINQRLWSKLDRILDAFLS